MKITTWAEILSQKPKKIKIVGYGSLLNNNTHHTDHYHEPVIVRGIKRIYNVQMLPIGEKQEFYDLLFEKHKKNYGIETFREFEENIGTEFGVLNCVIGMQDDYVNGLMFDIDHDHLDSYALRESQYDLIEVSAEYIKNNKEETAYILTSKDHHILDNITPFGPYHANTRKGAYNIGDLFGKMFDETTFDISGNLIKN